MLFYFVIFFVFFLFLQDYFCLFLGEDILDSAVYNRGENANGHTNGNGVAGTRFEASSPIIPDYGTGNLGKTIL